MVLLILIQSLDISSEATRSQMRQSNNLWWNKDTSKYLELLPFSWWTWVSTCLKSTTCWSLKKEKPNKAIFQANKYTKKARSKELHNQLEKFMYLRIKIQEMKARKHKLTGLWPYYWQAFHNLQRREIQPPSQNQGCSHLAAFATG